MKIVIIGAGIAGCAAYLELRKHLPSDENDHEITIYEAYDTHEDTTSEQRGEGVTHSSTLVVGGGLGIAPNGLNVLKRLDTELLRDIVKGGYTVSHSNMKNKDGYLLMRMDSQVAGSTSSRDNAPPMYQVTSSRHSLWRCLRTRIPTHHIVNKRVLEVVSRSEGRNLVKFADGSPEVEADLVIGADGIRSTTRRAIFSDTEEDLYRPHYEGLVGVGGFIPSSTIKDLVEKGSLNFIFGGNGFFGYFFSNSAPDAPHRDSPYHVSEPGDSVAWWSTYAIKECPENHKSLDTEDVMRQLRQRHGQWGDPVVQHIIQAANIQSMYPTWTVPPLPTWERDGVILVGDAAHALPSTSGQGSSQALEDCEALAILLAHQLGSLEGKKQEPTAQKDAINGAAKLYVTLRRPHVQEILEAARRMQNSKREMGVIQEYMMYGFMKLFGMVPNLATKNYRKVCEYDVAEEVSRLLAAGQ